MEKKTKASKTQKPANFGYTVLATVPYQLCPKCNGDGEVLVQNWNGGTTSISTGMFTCNVCGGAKIIPMHVINQELLKISSKNYGEDGIGLTSEEISKLL